MATQKEVFYLQFEKKYHGKTFGQGRVITEKPFEENNLEMAMHAIDTNMAKEVSKNGKPLAKPKKESEAPK